jgi:hypothetical protein
MTRFYYPVSRSHHAFCMAVDFGMEFANRFGKWQRDSLVHLTGATGYKLYVHEDSLGILEPRVGDLGIIYGNVPAVFDGTAWCVGDSRETSEFDRIIQRDGLPFHYPDQEP